MGGGPQVPPDCRIIHVPGIPVHSVGVKPDAPAKETHSRHFACASCFNRHVNNPETGKTGSQTQQSCSSADWTDSSCQLASTNSISTCSQPDEGRGIDSPFRR